MSALVLDAAGVQAAPVEEVGGKGAGLARLVRLGVPDRYAHGASRRTLMRENEIDALALVRAAEGLLGVELGVDEVPAVQADPVEAGGFAKPEAL